VVWQAARIFSVKPAQMLEDFERLTVYLSRYARISPSEQAGRTWRQLLGWVRQTSRFLEQEAGKAQLAPDGEDR